MKFSGILKDDTGASFNLNVELTPVVVQPPAETPPEVEPPVVVPPVVEPPVVQPPSAATIPLSWSAPQFANNVVAPSTRVASGGTLKNKSITDTGNTASVVTGDSAIIQNIRIKSREGIRIGGGGNFLIDGCYIEVNGTGDDHADGIQTYSPGSKGVLKIRNTTVKCGIDKATAGLFVADKWGGTVDLENVVIWGGPYGARIHADGGGDITVRFKNVFVVGPFAYAGLWVDSRTLNGNKNVIELWENVREATIVNGVLVPGKLITA